jgi:hypothetical protein
MKNLQYDLQMNHDKTMMDGTARLSISGDDDSTSTNLSQHSSNASNLLTRTTIREANNHLQMLYARNQELEEIIHRQKDEIHRKDLEYANLVKASQLLERHCQQLQGLVDDRTRRLYIYERKEPLFRETLELKPAIESLLDVLTTFEQVDQVSSTSTTMSINTKPLQFVQSSVKDKNTDVAHRTDTV